LNIINYEDGGTTKEPSRVMNSKHYPNLEGFEPKVAEESNGNFYIIGKE